MNTDPISDYLTRIRNAVMANHRMVEVPTSNIKKEITKILFEKGYILNYKFEDDTNPGIIKIALKYHPGTKQSAIKTLERISKTWFETLCFSDNLPRVLNGLGIAIISTSKGLLSDKEARLNNVGGEVIVLLAN